MTTDEALAFMKTLISDAEWDAEVATDETRRVEVDHRSYERPTDTEDKRWEGWKP